MPSVSSAQSLCRPAGSHCGLVSSWSCSSHHFVWTDPRVSQHVACHSRNLIVLRISSRNRRTSSDQRIARARALHHSIRNTLQDTWSAHVANYTLYFRIPSCISSFCDWSETPTTFHIQDSVRRPSDCPSSPIISGRMSS
jgi:hypothetical protein